jgi:hypothetical protein
LVDEVCSKQPPGSRIMPSSPWVIDAKADGYIVTVAAIEPGSAPVRSSSSRTT